MKNKSHNILFRRFKSMTNVMGGKVLPKANELLHMKNIHFVQFFLLIQRWSSLVGCYLGLPDLFILCTTNYGARPCLETFIIKVHVLESVLRILIRIRIHRIHVFLGLLDPDPLVGGMDTDLAPAPDPDPLAKIVRLWLFTFENWCKSTLKK